MLWTVVLYSIFPPLVLLVLLLLSPHRLRDYANRLVDRALFSRFRVLPCSFIKIVLTVLLFVWIAQLVSVIRHAQAADIKAGVAGSAAGLGVDSVLFQSKGWRSQRNLYLTSLSLVLWWMLYSVHVLSVALHAALTPAPNGTPAAGAGPKAAVDRSKTE